MDALIIRHDCFKLHGDAYTLSAEEMLPSVCGVWRCKSYADIRRGSLVRWCQMRVQSSKMRVFSVDRNIFCVKFPTGLTYRNLYGFARFLGATARLVLTRDNIRPKFGRIFGTRSVTTANYSASAE